MAQINAGRVRFISRGEYNNSTQYYVFDFVNYNGNSYFAKQNTQGNLPTNTTYWQLVAEKGNVGNTGATGNGIASVTKTGTSGLVDTYTITFTNGNTTTFTVANGNGIDRIELTSTSGAVKTYTIYYTNGTTSTFDVTDGEVTQEQLDETNEEVERAKMVYNALPKVNGTGTSITMNNTAECPVYDVELSPSALEQATTTGKNNIPTQESAWEQGTILSSNGENSSSTTRIRTIGYYPITQGDYYLSIQNNNYCWLNILYYDNNNNYITSQFSISSVDGMQNAQISIPDNVAYFRAIIRKTDDSTITTTEIETIKPMIEQSLTATEYEPYTGGQPSPNPQYPQTIHTVSGDNNVKIYNLNIWNEQWENGYWSRSTGAKGSGDNYLRCTDYIPITPNTSIYFTKPSEYANYSVIFYDNTKTIIANVPTYTSSQSFTSPSNASYFTFYCALSSGTATYNNNIMINYGTTAKDYVSHQEQNFPITLGDLEYCKIGDYEDEFMKPSGKNLFDKDNIIEGKYIDTSGDLVNDSSNFVGDYIAIDNTKSYYASQNIGGSIRIGYYDSSKIFISRELIASNAGSLTIPNNAEYVRLSCYNTSLDTLQLEQGLTATPYEPYNNGKWYLKKNINKQLIRFSTATLEVNGIRVSSISVPRPINTYPTLYCNYFQMANNYKEAVNDGANTPNRLNLNASGNVLCNVYGYTTTTEYINLFTNNNIYIYYPVETPTYTLLNSTLQTQLDNIYYNAISYQGQTNISQTNNDLPFVIKLSAIRDMSGIFELIQ